MNHKRNARAPQHVEVAINGQSANVPLPERTHLLDLLCLDILQIYKLGGSRIAIDGTDGAGKTMLGDELAKRLEEYGCPIVRASVDGFHHPQSTRYKKGRTSPVGFYEDSYDYARFLQLLVEPFQHRVPRKIVRAIYDIATEQPVPYTWEIVPGDALLICDGIFLHRAECCELWDYSIWLEVPATVACARGALRGYGNPDALDVANDRYVSGQALYRTPTQPMSRATCVIDNTDLQHPILLRRPDR